MSTPSSYRNGFAALLLGLVLSAAGVSLLWISSERRVENNPDTYATGVSPTPELLVIVLLLLLMVVLTLAALIFLVLWLRSRTTSTRSAA